ncbi:MAG: hypothetical protein PVI21_05110 [Candidatus Woesebacteria bacterium]
MGNLPTLPSTVEQGLSVLSELINNSGGNFKTAYQFARQLNDAFVDDPRTWSQLVLVCNLTDRNDEATNVQVAARSRCPTWSNLHEGDCERDQALYCIRYKLLGSAERHIERAIRLHADNPNRLAALQMVHGRICYARGHYQLAISYLDNALRQWNALTKRINSGEKNLDRADPQWRLNCMRWLLKSTIANSGRCNRSKDIFDELRIWARACGRTKVPMHTRLASYGKFFNKLDDLIKSPYGHELLRRLGFETLARRLLL